MSYSFHEHFVRDGPLLAQLSAIVPREVAEAGGTLEHFSGDDDEVLIVVRFDEDVVRARDPDLDMNHVFAPDGLIVVIQAEPTTDPTKGRLWVDSNDESNRACWETVCGLTIDLAVALREARSPPGGRA
ncbi:MAG: hypothetical protein KC731_10235 [Myxococcales bacterium]|nr:hypothetical protein [Myxococcales bacterium]